MIVFISCTKKKQNHPCSAKDMYSASQWFKLAYSYAESLKPNEIYILSAKYGLLHTDSKIEPYEKTLITEKDKQIRLWSKMVAEQIQRERIDRNQTAIFLCGKNYRKYIQHLFQKSHAPCSHLGIGKQLQFFKENTRKREVEN